MIIECQKCGKKVETKSRKRKFCSRSCKEKSRIESNKITATCLYCNKTFETNSLRQAKFCSFSCGTRYGNKNKDLIKTLVCIDCGLVFEFKGRTTKKRCDSCKKKFKSKCVMIHRAEKNTNVKLGVGSGGAQTPYQILNKGIIQKNKYTNYRKLVLTGKDKCDICGYNTLQDALEVHHKDYNRYNNELENLVILCSNCHSVLHKITKKLYINKQINIQDIYPLIKEDLTKKKFKHNML